MIPNAAPFVFEFDTEQDCKIIKNYYIEDEKLEVYENVKADEARLN